MADKGRQAKTATNFTFAHRQCVQRWCNEKRDITCEICHQEVGQDSQRWKKRAILLIYLVHICLKPKQKPNQLQHELEGALQALEKSQCCSPST